MIEELTPIKKLTRDLAKAAITLSDTEARFLVDSYYLMQDYRISTGNQIHAMDKANEPHVIISWFTSEFEGLENQIKRALDKYTSAQPVSVWAKDQYGIGPIIAAGLTAHMGDPLRFSTIGNWWAYCGLAPGQQRKKGERVNWNPQLKRLAWLIGESFVKVSGKEDAFYGKLYNEKKDYYLRKNEKGEFADRAKEALANKKFGKDTDAFKAYDAGKLPPAHIHAMAKRYAAKVFLSHFLEVGYKSKGAVLPRPYAIAHLEHAHMIEVPE